MRAVAAAVLILLATAAFTPTVTADHPGSNQGLSRFTDLATLLGVAPTQLVHNVRTVEMAFAEWEAAYPDHVERMTIGKTSSGMDLAGVIITDESVPFDAAALSTGHKLRVYLDGGHHGNEYLGVELVMYYIESILGEIASGNEDTAKFLQNVEIHAVPIINIDGNTLDTRKNSRQVDVNRNYDYQWGGPGSGGSVSDLNYRGPSAHSEAEVRANAEYAQAISPDLWITMHTGVAEFYWPWGWTPDAAPDQVFFESLEKPFENATNGRVDAMQAAELYVAAGATDDYGYAVVGTPSFTFEVHEDQFIPVYGEGIPTVIAEQIAGLDFMVKNVKNLGAWVEAHPTGDGGWVAHNFGWGVATNVTIGEHLIDRIEPGEMVSLDFVPADGTEVRYPILLIESSRVRTHTVSSVTSASTETPTADVPAPGVFALFGLVALVAIALRRR